MKNLILTLLAFCLAGIISAQSFGEIQGKISDEKGAPMPMVYVSIKTATTTFEATTDYDGKFKIKPIPAGTYTLETSFIGYNKFRMVGVKINSDKITRLLDLKMSTNVEIIEGTVIHAFPIPLIDPEGTSIRTIDMDDFKNSPTKSVAGVITAISSDISSGDNGELYFRGSRNGSTVMYLDGVKIMGTNLPSIPSRGIKNVMVYTGGVPAKYGDTTGGVVVIETKSSFAEYYKRQARLNQ